MKIIDEGSLRFIFPDHWHAIKYDDTSFYRKNICSVGANLKAIDILVVPNPEQDKILLIEIKDFRGHSLANKRRITSGDLITEVIEKAMHTLSALHLASYCRNAELAHYVTDALRPPNEIELILVLEQDPIPIPQHVSNNTKNKLAMQVNGQHIENMTLSFRSKLKKNLKIHSKVITTSSIKARDGFSINPI